MSPRRSVYLKTQNHHVVSRLIFSLTPLQRRIRWTTNFRLYSSMTFQQFQQFKQLCRTSACDQALLLQFHGHYLRPLSRSILSYCTRNFEWESLGSKGNHLCVTCWSVCDQDQNFWSAKSLITWSTLLKWMISWFYGVKGQIAAQYSWSFDFRSLEVTLIPWSALKRLWSLDSILITVANASTQDIQVTTSLLMYSLFYVYIIVFKTLCIAQTLV